MYTGLEDTLSPIAITKDLSGERELFTGYYNEDSKKAGREKAKISNEFQTCLLTPPAPETSSVEERRVKHQTVLLMRALVNRGLMKRTRSMPSLTDDIEFNTTLSM